MAFADPSICNSRPKGINPRTTVTEDANRRTFLRHHFDPDGIARRGRPRTTLLLGSVVVTIGDESSNGFHHPCYARRGPFLGKFDVLLILHPVDAYVPYFSGFCEMAFYPLLYSQLGATGPPWHFFAAGPAGFLPVPDGAHGVEVGSMGGFLRLEDALLGELVRIVN